MGDLLITVAPTGAETTKADCPQLPTTLAELVETAQRCEAAGAAMVHVHIRDDEHRPTLDQHRLAETVAALRESTGLVVQLSTGGSVHDPLDDRLRVLDARPDSCSLTMGTTNFGDDVFLNPWPFVCDLYQLSQERRGRARSSSCSTSARSRRCTGCWRSTASPTAARCTSTSSWASPAACPAPRTRSSQRSRRCPAQTTSWSATGIGRSTLAVALAVALQGRPPPGRHGGRADPGQGRAGRAQRAAGHAGPPSSAGSPSAHR